MRTSFVTLFGLVASALAMPATLVTERQAGLCSSALGTPLCCDVDVLGVADLNCETPPEIPTDLANFTDVCAAVGKIDMCCILPILEQGILCQTPS
ncbi:fungal hydrophobin [Phlyctema vagabunda]|uniref:Fungal hydrophobin n=1 Tax=Phlyctema vagabunda TaxID=108571 RepID=A0ABR4PXA9_9HELO